VIESSNLSPSINHRVGRITMKISKEKCSLVYIFTKNSFNNEIHDNDIETVGIGLVATSNSINNVFHSNTVTDGKFQTTLQDSTSNGNNFENNNKKIVSFDTLKEKRN
jgi:hypothetical protein